MMCIGGMSAWVVSQHTTLMKIAHGMNEMKSCDMFFFYFHFCSCSLCVCFGVSRHRLRRKLFIFLFVAFVLHTTILFIRMQWTHGREITRQNILNSLFSLSGSRAHVCVCELECYVFCFRYFFILFQSKNFPQIGAQQMNMFAKCSFAQNWFVEVFRCYVIPVFFARGQ